MHVLSESDTKLMLCNQGTPKCDLWQAVNTQMKCCIKRHLIRTYSVCWNKNDLQKKKYNSATECDFQQCGILTWIDSDVPVQPPFKLRNSNYWSSVSGSIFTEYSSNWQRLWSDCVYVQAGLSLCWSHIPHCWKSHVTAQLFQSKS